MAKRFTASAKQLKPDPVYSSKLVSKFINSIMWKGKKSVAQRVVYDSMDVIGKKIKDASPLEVFETAINNVKPMIEVRSRRVGGASYQVPMQVRPERQRALAFRWVIQAARGKKGKPMHLGLAEELMAAYRREGAAMTTRENVHRMADANKAFAHFAW
ncbi:MAG: 30S ribosomal protein S7 [Sedimentisphaerales bacterium]|nr:30S ribosomal protein S7 [Sedimentisphaerales bacterium]